MWKSPPSVIEFGVVSVWILLSDWESVVWGGYAGDEYVNHLYLRTWVLRGQLSACRMRWVVLAISLVWGCTSIRLHQDWIHQNWCAYPTRPEQVGTRHWQQDFGLNNSMSSPWELGLDLRLGVPAFLILDRFSHDCDQCSARGIFRQCFKDRGVPAQSLCRFGESGC